LTQVRKIREVDGPEVVETFAQSFFDDPLMRWWISEEARRKEILPNFFGLMVGAFAPAEQIYSADGVAAALWVPPGTGPTEEENAQLGEAMVAIAPEYAERGFAIMAATEAVHPTEEHFYLFFLGTRPPFQGRGLGGALLREVLAHCDATGTPAYLEASSENNRRLYERHGFVLQDELRVQDSPPLWLMWRAARG
jgi:ribosomal protein S18 acetylase RimI-like enzyme